MKAEFRLWGLSTKLVLLLLSQLSLVLNTFDQIMCTQQSNSYIHPAPSLSITSLSQTLPSSTASHSQQHQAVPKMTRKRCLLLPTTIVFP